MIRNTNEDYTERNILALAMLTRFGLTLEVEEDSIEPLYHEGRFLGDRQKYEVTITRDETGEEFVTPFTGSAVDFQAGIDPSDWEILHCISLDAYYGDEEEVIGLGYDPEEDADKIREIAEHSRRIGDFFSVDEILEFGTLED